ncbi:hypothetical protein T439DRAFT_384531 [Meredithblackwellia eburnea MCA 4105]
MLGSSILSLAALSLVPALVLASPLDPKAALTERNNRCYPQTAGKKFQISLAQPGGDSNPTLLANLHNCIQQKCVHVYLDDVPTTSSSQWIAWYAKSKNGDSTPPLEISSGITEGGGVTCLVNPTWGSQIGANNCIPGEVTQEYVISCENCYSPFLDLGINCQIKSWDWGQCWTSTGKGGAITLKECEAFGTASQTFNVIEYSGKTA